MYPNHLIFDIIILKYKLHNLVEKVKNIIVTDIVTFPKWLFCNKETIKGSNHFKIHILGSLI